LPLDQQRLRLCFLGGSRDVRRNLHDDDLRLRSFDDGGLGWIVRIWIVRI
jgi:hypothetical protein